MSEPKRVHSVTLLPGAGAGPEAAAVTRAVLSALDVEVDWHLFEETRTLSPAAVADARKTGFVLKGQLDAPNTPGALPPTVQLRKDLGTWATIRHALALPGAGARFPDLDLVVIRETSEDIYAGFEHEITEGVYEAVKVTTRHASERIARFAYETARQLGRKKVTIVHKSNIMKKSDGLFLRTCQEVGRTFPDIITEEVIVDALCMRLVRNPHQFDVLVAGNLFGDIVSDLCSGLAGGVTASPSVSVGDGVRIYEVPHGGGNAGGEFCNPVPMLRCARLLLEGLGEAAAAARLKAAIASTTESGIKTPDLGGSSTTNEVCAGVLAALSAQVR